MKNAYFKTHLRLIALLFLFLISQNTFAQSQTVEISGIVKDRELKEPLPGATVAIKGTAEVTSTNENGEFFIKTQIRYPFTLVFSGIGFRSQEVQVLSSQSKIAVELNTENTLLNEVVVSASRVEERILQSPISIEKIDIKAIKDNPAPTFYEALDNVKGVQLLTSSLTLKVPNARGFNVPNNFRFMQLVDGVDVQAATLGVPLGNAIGPTELDIQSVEITPGAASALYGMNAINGLASLQTRSPFTHQGLSLYQRTGVNHVNDNDKDASIVTEVALRYAKVFKDKFAIKVNGSFFKGTDWISNTLTDQNPNNLVTANPGFGELSGVNNPAADLWNNYGDERNNRVTVTATVDGAPKTFNVSRTGYLEKDLVDPTVTNAKFDAGAYYKIRENLEVSYVYRYGLMDGTFQRGNKIRLEDATVQNHKVELKGEEFYIRTYASLEETGDSYNLKPLADNLDLTHASNADWRTSFQNALQASINNGTPLQQAFTNARTMADQGRVEPGTPEFDALKNTIISTNNWDHLNSGIAGAPATGGAWLKQKSALYHVEGQYDFSKYIKIFDLQAGADYRQYLVTPDGNNFVDFGRQVAERNVALANGTFGDKQKYEKYGVFAQITKRLFDNKLKINASLRADRNPEFDTKFNPRIAFVYSPTDNHNFRASFQNGFRFPSLFEALSFVNNGNVRRVGGLARVNEGIGFLENSYTLTSIDNFNAAVNAAVDGGADKNQAALDNKNILVKANLSQMKPEQINSFEIGYKSVVLNNTISIDWDAYFNIYDGFLGQVEVAVPKTGTVGTDAAVLAMLTRNQQDRYRVFTNSANKYKSYGSTFGIKYNFYEDYNAGFNVSYNDLVTNSKSDIFTTSFNTPKWVTNLSFGNRQIVKNVGFNIVGRWQDAFYWESTLANGDVPAYFTMDAQVNVKIPMVYATAKIGGTNILNNRYYQYAAGPTIGALYYVALTFELANL
ncbi:energy transducer TonB [Flavobacterium zepuense]|uniref:Energy transducer TonB n=1 Tax=Flavobacterium zepuense TaxID=2593302 RepID=A0A552UYU9_9FLAO|nr:TonB-dependent receptor [Flavobacterium zepuense]TRW23426.1 energy transducer TonB [Flavobacterium zepuense]